MIRISSLLRRTLNPCMDLVRGPKKKKGETETKIQSTDIVNIFKERADPVLRDIREYPIFVQQLSYGLNTIHQQVLGIEHNIPNYKPYRANYNGFLKAWGRQRTKAINQWKHLDAKPDIMSDNDLNERRILYAVGVMSKQEMDEKIKAEEDEAAAQEDDDE